MILYLICEWTLWYVDMLSQKEGHMVYAVKVCDFRGMGSDGRSLPIFVPKFKSFLIGTLMKCLTHHYCEHDSLFIVVNTPMAFRAIFQVAKVVLSKRQVSKFRIVGDTSNPKTREILEQVISNKLVTEYGGQVAKAPGAFPLATAEEIEIWFQTRKQVPIEYVDNLEANPNSTNGAKLEPGSLSPQDTQANSTKVQKTAGEQPSLDEGAQFRNVNNEENQAMPPALGPASPQQDDQVMIEGASPQTQCELFACCKSA